MSAIERRLREMDEKLDDIQGDVSILAAVNKEKDRVTIKNLINRVFGTSQRKRRCFYYCNDKRTIREIGEMANVAESNVRTILAKLNKEGLVAKREEDGHAIYRKKPITQGIGLEKDLRQYFEAEGE